MVGTPVFCATFVAREAELAALHDARRSLARSQSSVVLLSGEAGIGKSRLLAQFLRESAQTRARTIESAECLEHARQTLGPVRVFLRRMRRLVTNEGMPPLVCRALAQLTPDLAARTAPATEVGELEKPELFAAVLEFLKVVCAKRAVILTIEDVHWADDSTLEFVTYLAGRVTGMRLLVIATYRSEEVEGNAALFAAISAMEREPSVRSIRLEALEGRDLRALLSRALDGHAALSRSTIDDVARRSEGNPFFAEELLKNALDGVRSSSTARLPLSIRASILKRLASLDEDDRHILAHAAVLGDRFDPTILALTMQREVETVLPALRAARDLNIIADDDGPRARCRFRHALTRQTIYGEMLDYESTRLHAAILTTIEALGGDDYLEALAYHAREAHDAAKTLLYNTRAGESALGFRALAEAASYFEYALEAASEPGDKARLLERIGSVAEMQGRLTRAIEVLEAALTLRLNAGEYDDAARIVGSVVGDRSNRGEALSATLVRADAFLATYASHLGRAAHDRLAAFAARLASASFDFDTVERLLATVSPPETLEPRVRQNYYLADLNRSSYFGDVAAWQRTAERFDTIESLPPLLRAIAAIGVAQTGMYLGVNDEVERAFTRSERVIAEWQLAGVAVFVAAVRAVHHWLQGRLPEARAAIERALARPEIAVAGHVLATVGPHVALATGDPELARRCSTEDVMRDAHGGGVESARQFAARAVRFAAAGRLTEAQADLDAALAELRDDAPASGTVLAVAARYVRVDALDRVRERLGPMPLDERNVAARATGALVRSILASRSDNASDTLAYANVAQQAFAAIGWPLFEAQALELAGRPRDALARYERCGAIADVRRLAPPTPSPVDGVRTRESLSTREREVAELVSYGLTNRAIAERLIVTDKTIEKHLSSIFAKLAVRSRAQVAAVIAASRPDTEAEKIS